MYIKAVNLKISFEQLKMEAKHLMEESILTSDIGYSMMVFEQIEDLLPTLSCIPSKKDYPLFRKYLNDHLGIFELGKVYSFTDLFEDEFWFALDAEEEEQKDFIKKGFDPTENVDVLWEIIKGGNSKFTYDW